MTVEKSPNKADDGQPSVVVSYKQQLSIIRIIYLDWETQTCTSTEIIKSNLAATRFSLVLSVTTTLTRSTNKMTELKSRCVVVIADLASEETQYVACSA